MSSPPVSASMVSMPLWLTPMANRARKLKEMAAHAEGKDSAVPPLVSWSRGMTEIEWAMAKTVDRDEGLRLAHVGITGFNADSCILCLETWASRSMINPQSGENWDQYEMSRLAETDPLLAAKTLTEQFWLFRLTRDSDTIISDQMPFRVKADRVRWLPTRLVSDVKVEGLVIDAVREMFTVPAIVDIALEHFGGPPDTGRDPQYHCDRATRAAMLEFGATLFLHPEDSTQLR